LSLQTGLPWSYQGLDFKGYSVAGQTTSLLWTNPKICFDIAQGLPWHLPAKLFCLTHLHADHGSGLSYVLSQRSLFGLGKANIMLPQSVVESVHRILQEWMQIEGFQYSYQLIPVQAGTRYAFSDHLEVEAFPTTHRVDSFGYLVYEKKKKLQDKYHNYNRQQILDAKTRGEVIEDEVRTPMLAFTGDTQIEFLQAHPDVLRAKLLFMECTYLDQKRSVDAAREWGHIHLDEVLENLHLLKNEHISLIHLSARYSTSQATTILNDRLPFEARQRFSVFPRPL
jgi:ribonuclease Z